MTAARPAGAWLAAVRRSAGLTQAAAARRAGFTSRAWQSIEAGHRAAPHTLARLAEVLALDAAAVRHLDRLNRPPYAAPVPPDPVHLSLLVAGLAVPAWVVDPAWTVLSASPVAAPTVHNVARWAIQIRGLWDDWPTIAGPVGGTDPVGGLLVRRPWAGRARCRRSPVRGEQFRDRRMVCWPGRRHSASRGRRPSWLRNHRAVGVAGHGPVSPAGHDYGCRRTASGAVILVR
ncbi:helix-turn-helix transcriptional regulator [Micromonospora sp. Llam7]|uniref:helix-turn-helix domain-containing protein n=1 Tax=Micromonospora tarapacensis TaxID=2835305 RepID=UPI001C828506|nr:helix-turn-helix transcriptional regulator [Micromonospora tarapacensis]